MTDGSAWRQAAGNGGNGGRGTPSVPLWAHPAPTPPTTQIPYGAAGRHGSPGPSGVFAPTAGFHNPGHVPPGRPPAGPADAWWSDARCDPWRDPNAPAVVVADLPASPGPALEAPADTGSAGTKRPVGIGLVVVVAAVSALLAGVLGGTLGYVFAARAGGGQGVQLGAGKAPRMAQRAPDSVAGVVRKVLPSVVTLRVRAGDNAALGSGFVVSTDGYVVTNNHVVEGGSGPIQVTFSDASTVTAKVVGSEPESDLAVVKVDKSGLSPVEFGDSEALQVGDPVIAVGSPLALTNTVTSGIVSAIDRPIRTEDSAGGVRYYAAIQTDAAVNQGNSGGPLFDGAGRVVGVNSVIGSLAEDEQHAGNVGLAFAIPVNQTRRIAKDIIDTGKARRTVIGAQLDNTYTSGGARLARVEPGGPAANAGLHTGDVVVRVGPAVVDESWDVIALVRKYSPGATVPVEYIRGSLRKTVQVKLAADAK